MSKRNSQAAKRAARERLRAEQERQAKKDKMRRQLIVAGSVVGVLALAGGVSYAIVQANQPTYWETAQKGKLVKPANTEGKNGTTVVIGEDDAKKTLEIYEDPRCPVCATFEQGAGEQLKQDVADGKYKVQFIGATFLDGDNLEEGEIGSVGEGSKNALSALGAALNVSPDAFLDYKSALYSPENHPEESEDKFKDDAYLLKVANDVPELKNSKAFQKDVKSGTFDKWALEMSTKFATTKGVTGTPTLMMDGKKLEGDVGGGQKGTPMTKEQFNTVMEQALKG